MFLFAPVRWAFKLVSLAITAAVVYIIVCGVQVVATANGVNATPNVQRVDAIVVTDVPGASSGSAPDPDFLARLKESVHLHSTFPNAPIIVAGPSVANSSSIASLGAQWLERNGLSGANVSTVVTSNGGEFNAVRLAMGSNRNAIIVTDAIDAMWAKNAASKAGIVPTVAVPTSSEKVVFAEISPLWHEATGIAVGRLIGYDHATWAAS